MFLARALRWRGLREAPLHRRFSISAAVQTNAPSEEDQRVRFPSIRLYTRENESKFLTKKLRLNGKLPAAIYGKGLVGKKSITEIVAVDLRDVEACLRKYEGSFENTMFMAVVDGKETIVVSPRDLQLDPVTDVPVSVNFLRFRPGVILNIPVEFSNFDASPGLKRGGYMNIVQRTIPCRCDTNNVPQSFKIDVAGLHVCDHIGLDKISFPEGITPAKPERSLVATIGGKRGLRPRKIEDVVVEDDDDDDDDDDE